MAAIDGLAPFSWPGAGAILIEDGAGNSASGIFEGAFSFEATGRASSEARNRGRHLSIPVEVEGDDGDVSISLSGLLTSMKGINRVHPYEAMTFTQGAAAWVSVGRGNKKMFRLTVTALDPDSGATQQVRFSFCKLDSISCDFVGESGKATFEASITDRENYPTVT
ncbi:MAG: hypothetical protein AAFV53_16560 [Myxococcota bacterium]